jgi:Nif-specific regulatory protein
MRYTNRLRQRPFKTITPRARHLIESELFGHEKGVQRHHQPAQGRLNWPTTAPCFSMKSAEFPHRSRPNCCAWLPEVGERWAAPTIKVNVRIIAATNRDLEEEVTKGEFRKI